MATKNLLALDFGAESGRVMLGCFDGARISLEELHRFPTGFELAGEYRRWNVPRFLAEIRKGIAMAAGKGAVASLGIDTWGVDGGFINTNGELCGWPYAYRDFTKENMEACWAAFGGPSALYRTTGIHHWPFNTSCQLFALTQRQDEILKSADKFLFMPDLLLYLLTGHMVCEETIASTSQLLDVSTRKWSDVILKTLHVPPSLFLPLTPPGTRTGRRVHDTQIEAVCVAGHDTGSAVAAVPVTHDRKWAFLSSGTWSIMGIESKHPIVTDQTDAMGIGNEWGVEGTYRVLRNVMGLWILQQCRQSWAKAGRELGYAQLVAEAEGAAPFKFLIDVDDLRFYAPDDMLAEVQTYCETTGQGRPVSVGEVVRCVMESLALRYAEIFARFSALDAAPIEAMHVIGGGVQNKLLCRMTAEACGVPVIAGPVEATALGNLMVQLIATGELAGREEGRAVIAASAEPETYEPAAQDAWKAGLQRLETLRKG
ncbi:MAG: rhamnulokinase [Kiritimatiellae bacterium]|nr:rhamnulokinase [Kiritimatiellia bacterium]